jgi:branched-chain amino acid transport system permease protein
MAMTSDAVASFRAKTSITPPLRRTVTMGLIFGTLAVYLAFVGLLLMLNGRWIVVQTLTLGQAMLVLVALGAGIEVARRGPPGQIGSALGQGLGAGAIAGAMLALLAIAMSLFPLRTIFIALSPELFAMLTFGAGAAAGVAILVLSGAVLGALGAALYFCPRRIRGPLLVGVMATVFVGVFQELLQLILQFGPVSDVLREGLFTWEGLTWEGALEVLVIATAVGALWPKARRPLDARVAQLPPARQRSLRRAGIGLVILILALFPALAGSYIGQVLMLVGLYILMGMGLNLEVGLAGLLDLGFVAFFAVGAYTTALLTADSPHALATYTILPSLNFWQAMPIAVLCSVVVGVLFGVPVLGVRGDYLAVATMGLGEIVRVIVQSDMAAPLLAGAQGVLQIPKPKLGGFELSDPVDLFYLTLASSALAAYCAWRLENSRLGRAWMALRDDEDVAQALGINLVKSKLLAYGLGAAFAGLAGSIFATMLTSIYPSSFQLLISINVLALIIVGGMGSLPGVVVGSVALVGLPELLREFGEYRYLFYGAALIVMMRIKPEGLWPSATRRRELRDADETELHDTRSAATIAARSAGQ